MASTAFVDGSTLTAAAWFNDVDTYVYSRLTSVSGTNTVVGTGPVSMTAYATGQRFIFIPANTNTGATTLNITPSGGSALGAKNIFSYGAACNGGELISGVPILVMYDGTQFNILSAHQSTGTWTPVVNGTNLGAVGKYTKIGRIVHLSFNNQTGVAALNNNTAASITGIPFNLSGTNTYDFGGACSLNFADQSDSFNLQPLVARFGTSASNSIDICNRSGVATTTSDPWNFGGTYIAA